MIERFKERLILNWLKKNLPKPGSQTSKVAALRSLEEILELSQSENISKKEAMLVLDQVYSRSVGQSKLEFGQVMICLSMYAGVTQMDMEEAWMYEFERINDPAVIAKIRARQSSKIGGASYDEDKVRDVPFINGDGLG